MQRIDTSTKFTDLFGAGKHGFRDGNKAAGVAATALNAALFNNVQEELCSVVEAANIALDGSIRNQVLLALRSEGVFTTPAKGDNTTKAATTDFVTQAGKHFSRTYILNANTALSAAYVGSLVLIAGEGLLIDLPSAASVSDGEGISFLGFGWVSNNSIRRTGTDIIYPNGATGGINSLAVGYGETITLVSNGIDSWFAADGDANAAYKESFKSSLLSNGYQRLPGGLYEIRGKWTANASPGAVTSVTFPISFPTALLELVVSCEGSSSALAGAWFDGPGANGFNGRSNVANATCHYIAKGK